jgi:uncharacterized protein YbcV (DUF1398 family)
MNPKVIEESIALSLAAKIKFPEVVKRLQAEGIERYIFDLVGLKVHFFSTNSEFYTLSLAYKATPVALHFDAASVEKSVASRQKGEITYVQFLDQIIAAGCTHYEVYIAGKKVIYFGREGSQHIQLFPGVKP